MLSKDSPEHSGNFSVDQGKRKTDPPIEFTIDADGITQPTVAQQEALAKFVLGTEPEPQLKLFGENDA